jgi:hypothetical protein
MFASDDEDLRGPVRNQILFVAVLAHGAFAFQHHPAEARRIADGSAPSCADHVGLPHLLPTGEARSSWRYGRGRPSVQGHRAGVVGRTRDARHNFRITRTLRSICD